MLLVCLLSLQLPTQALTWAAAAPKGFTHMALLCFSFHSEARTVCISQFSFIPSLFLQRATNRNCLPEHCVGRVNTDLIGKEKGIRAIFFCLLERSVNFEIQKVFVIMIYLVLEYFNLRNFKQMKSFIRGVISL